jgi:hypothetical protein
MPTARKPVVSPATKPKPARAVPRIVRATDPSQPQPPVRDKTKSRPGHEAQPPEPSGFESSAAESGYEAAYVRMVRADGSGLAPVAVELIPGKLIEGYTFAEGEPCLPRLTGDPMVSERPCPTGRRWVSRPGSPRVVTKRQALNYWLAEAAKDKREFAGDSDLDHRVDARIANMIRTIDHLEGRHSDQALMTSS